MRTQHLVAMALISCTVAQSLSPQQPPSSVLALNGVTVIDGTGAPPASNMTLLIEQDRIRDVFRTGEKTLPANATIRDLHGHFVIPGLIDAHVHVRPRAVENGDLARTLRGGVTAVRNMVGNCRVLSEMARRAARGEIESPDIYFSAVVAGPATATDSRRPRGEGGGPPGPGCFHRLKDESFDAGRLVTAAKGSGATGIKLYADLSAEATRRITEEAHRQGLAIWAHATLFPARPSELVRAGADVLSHAAYLIWETVDSLPDYHGRVLKAPFTRVPAADSAVEHVLTLMAERGTILDATLFLFENQAVTLDSPNPDFGRDRSTFEAAATWAAAVTRRARELGVPVAAGTDGMLPQDSASQPNLHREMELLVTRAGFSPLQAISSATSVAARTLRLEQTIGTIASGKQADLVILRTDPTADIRNTRDIAFVVKRGRVIPRPEY